MIRTNGRDHACPVANQLSEPASMEQYVNERLPAGSRRQLAATQLRRFRKHVPMTDSSRSADHSRVQRQRVLIVLGAASLLFVLLVPRVQGWFVKANVSATQTTMDVTAATLDAYAADHHGHYPETTEFAQAVHGSAFPQQSDRGLPMDAWGNELLYWCPGTFNRDSYDVSSAGPDGVFGNSDDITNWHTADCSQSTPR